MDNNKPEDVCPTCGDRLIALKSHMRDILTYFKNEVKKKQMEDNILIKKLEQSIKFAEEF